MILARHQLEIEYARDNHARGVLGMERRNDGET